MLLLLSEKDTLEDHSKILTTLTHYYIFLLARTTCFSCVLLNSLLYHKADQLALDARRRATRVGIARPGLANNIDDVVEDL